MTYILVLISVIFVILMPIIGFCIYFISKISYKRGQSDAQLADTQKGEEIQQEYLEEASKPALSADDLLKLMSKDGNDNNMS
jgi:hypothetical protein